MSNSMDVNARLAADTAAFDGPMQKSGNIAEATARQIEKASERARSAWARELLAQEKTEAAAARTARAKELAALQSDILSRSAEREALRQSSVASGLDRWVRSIDGGSAAALRAVGANNALAASHERVGASAGHSVSQMQATSAAIRSLEGNPGIRAFERFVTIIPGAAAALQTIFPLIGAIAAGVVIDKLGEEIYDTEQKGKHAGRELQKAFSEWTDEMKLSNIELAVTADKLEDDIAKLEKKPADGLRTGLDEATAASERLGIGLDKNIAKLEKLTQDNAIGFWSGLLSGSGETKDSANLALSVKRDIDKVRHENDEVVARARESGNPANVSQAETARLVALQAAYATADQKLKAAEDAARRAEDFRNSPNFGAAKTESGSNVQFSSALDNSANVNLLTGARAAMLQEQNQIGGEVRKGADEVVKAKLEGSKNIGEAATKAAEKRLKSMEADLALMKISRGMSEKAEYDFWDARRSAFVQGSQQYNDVIQKQAALAEAGARRTHEVIVKYQKEQEANAKNEGLQAVMRSMEEFHAGIRKAAGERQKVSDEAADSANELAAAAERTNAALQELSISEAAGKTISHYDAAVQLATLHTSAYGSEIDRLNAKAKQIAAAPYLTDAQKQEQLGRIASQGQNLRASQAEQMVRDNNALTPPSSSAAVGAKDALNELAVAARDSAKELHDFIDSSLKSINAAILDPKRGAFQNAGQSIARGAASTLLTKGEGKLLGALGFGGKTKPTGASGDAIHAIIDNLPGVSLPTALTNSLVPGGSGMGGQSMAQLGLSLLGLPAFAGGVDDFVGGAAWVGEKGPELVNLPRGSSVTPHGQSAAYSGGGPSVLHIHQDLRGASDVQMLRAAARQGAMEGHAAMAPHTARLATAMIQNDRKRSIGGQR